MTANVDLVRSIYAAWERGDYSSAEWAHPDIETVIADGPAAGSWTGLAGAAEGWRDFLDAWEGYRVEGEDYRELDDERVLVLIRRSGRGKRSGIELDQIVSKGAVVYHVRGGKVRRQVVYFDGERALVDLGLASEINSSPNVGFVRSIVEDWERGDFSSAEWAHPEIEFEVVGGPSPGSWRGLKGMAQGWRGFLSAWEEFHSVVDEYRELDDGRVLVLAHRTGRGKMSGLELEHVKTMTGTVFHLHNGQVTRLVVYFDSNRALADLGLPSEADSSGS